MDDGTSFLQEAMQRGESAIVITVASTKGSVPRDAGTRMVVTTGGVFGTIGGGHLEFKAIEIAKNMIAAEGSRALHRFVLGATLGQCCGGVVNLLFEPVAATTESDVSVVAPAPDFHVVLFGAGHVGRAVVKVLSELSCTIRWVDSREDEFPKDIPANVNCICTDAPEDEINAASAGSFFLVMTHSHALDQTLSERILRRAQDIRHALVVLALTERQVDPLRIFVLEPAHP